MKVALGAETTTIKDLLFPPRGSSEASKHKCMLVDGVSCLFIPCIFPVYAVADGKVELLVNGDMGQPDF